MGRNKSYDLKQWLVMARKSGYDAGALAKELKISRRQLERDTRHVFGSSPQKWLDEQRLALAPDLLKELRSVKTVAFLLGFKQHSHFSREFKSRYGHSPITFLALIEGGLNCVAHSHVSYIAAEQALQLVSRKVGLNTDVLR